MRISDWSSDVCSSDLVQQQHRAPVGLGGGGDVHVRHRQLLLLRVEFEAFDRMWVGEAFELRAVEGRIACEGGEGGQRDREGKQDVKRAAHGGIRRSEEHTSELQSLMRISYAVFCLKKKTRYSN